MRCARYSPVPGPQRGWRPPPLVAAAVRRHAAHTAAPDPVEDARTVGPARFARGAVYRLALQGPIAPGARSRSAGWLGWLGAACHVCHVVCAAFPLCRAARPPHNFARRPTDHRLTDRPHPMHANAPSPHPATAGPLPRSPPPPIPLIPASTDIGAGVR